jgi:hypothetical protein
VNQIWTPVSADVPLRKPPHRPRPRDSSTKAVQNGVPRFEANGEDSIFDSSRALKVVGPQVPEIEGAQTSGFHKGYIDTIA